ncbi:MAG: hypothetical protein Q4E88_04040 [Coriobacteriia bacterium]|nr:hypothetical protein [Coriobacteriia bacterium]
MVIDQNNYIKPKMSIISFEKGLDVITKSCTLVDPVCPPNCKGIACTENCLSNALDLDDFS